MQACEVSDFDTVSKKVMSQAEQDRRGKNDHFLYSRTEERTENEKTIYN